MRRSPAATPDSRQSQEAQVRTPRYETEFENLQLLLLRQQVVVFASGTLHAPVTCNMKFMANRDVGKRVAEHRVRLRDQGLRPLQIWVPDTRAPEFAEEAHRQSALAAAIDNASDDQAFVDAISQFNDEDVDT